MAVEYEDSCTNVVHNTSTLEQQEGAMTQKTLQLIKLEFGKKFNSQNVKNVFSVWLIAVATS